MVLFFKRLLAATWQSHQRFTGQRQTNLLSLAPGRQWHLPGESSPRLSAKQKPFHCSTIYATLLAEHQMKPSRAICVLILMSFISYLLLYMELLLYSSSDFQIPCDFCFSLQSTTAMLEICLCSMFLHHLQDLRYAPFCSICVWSWRVDYMHNAPVNPRLSQEFFAQRFSDWSTLWSRRRLKFVSAGMTSQSKPFCCHLNKIYTARAGPELILMLIRCIEATTAANTRYLLAVTQTSQTPRPWSMRQPFSILRWSMITNLVKDG